MVKETNVPAKTAEAVFEELLDKGVELVRKYSHNTLDFYWGMGGLAREAQAKTEAKYGAKVIDKFCQSLCERTGVDYKPKTIYGMIAVRERVTPEQFKKLKENAVPWRSVLLLGSKGLTEEKLEALVSDVAAGAVSYEEATERVREVSPKSRKDKVAEGDDDAKELKAALSVVKGAASLFAMLSDKINGVAGACSDVFRSGDPAAMREAYAALMDANEKYEVLADRWGRQFEKAVEASTKVKDILEGRQEASQKKGPGGKKG